MAKSIIILNNTTYCGGTLVLSCLCKTLRELGYDAKMIMYPLEYNSSNDIKSHFRIIRGFHFRILLRRFIDKYCPFVRWLQSYKLPHLSSLSVPNVSLWKSYKIRDSIVVYPEIIKGNPLLAKNVVRWLLYHYEYENDTTAYSKKDLFVAFRKVFSNARLNVNENVVTINYFDKSLYRQYNFKERHGECYVLHKGRNRPDLPTKYNGPVYDHNMTQEEIVEMFNNYKYCYFYDLQTFFATIAAVCGCIPIMMLEKGKTVSDYKTPNEPLWGRAWGNTPEQIQYAIDTRQQLIESLDFEEQNRMNAQKFIKLLEEKFGEINKI